jgi:hypothetical protein
VRRIAQNENEGYASVALDVPVILQEYQCWWVASHMLTKRVVNRVSQSDI